MISLLLGFGLPVVLYFGKVLFIIYQLNNLTRATAVRRPGVQLARGDIGKLGGGGPGK